MHRFTVRALAGVIVFVASSTLAQAAIVTFASPLGPEAPAATGSGFATVGYDTVAHTFDIDAFFSGLSGTTTVAHIHCCVTTPGTGTAGVAVTPVTLPGFPAGVQAGSYSAIIDLTLPSSYTDAFRNGPGGGTAAGAEAAIVAGILANRAYFNIHSSTFPGGEIRGFLQPVPEPATLLLIGAGALGIVVRGRSRLGAPSTGRCGRG